MNDDEAMSLAHGNPDEWPIEQAARDDEKTAQLTEAWRKLFARLNNARTERDIAECVIQYENLRLYEHFEGIR